MIRRRSLVVLLAACTLPAVHGAQAADPELPRENCTKRWTDIEGDGYSNPPGAPSANQVKTAGLDILSLFMRTTADDVQVFLKLKNIPEASAMPPNDPIYRYTVKLTHGTKDFQFTHQLMNATHAPVLSPAAGGKTYPVSVPAMTPAVTGSVDPAKDWVYIVAPRAAFEKVAGDVPLKPGEKFTKISATAHWAATHVESTHTVGDSLTPTGDAATWTIGDDYCFGPPPGALSDLVTPAVQFGDTANLAAKLVDEAGAPVADAPVTFTVGSAAPVTRNTDSAGVAKAPFVASLAAGTHDVTATFPGTATVGKATLTGSLVVKTEVTKFASLSVKRTSSTARSVTATLKDDDGKAVAKQKVGWYVNGRLVSTLVTDSSGRSTYKSAKARQTVQARFAGLAGKYAAAKSNAPKV